MYLFELPLWSNGYKYLWGNESHQWITSNMQPNLNQSVLMLHRRWIIFHRSIYSIIYNWLKEQKVCYSNMPVKILIRLSNWANWSGFSEATWGNSYQGATEDNSNYNCPDCTDKKADCHTWYCHPICHVLFNTWLCS